MQELILYIRPQFRNNVTQDYVKVDMFSDENVTLTQVIQDVRDIDKVFTDFSQTFSLPASKINNKLFQHWYNPDIDGFDSNIQSEAIIELNYQPFKSGKIQLQEVKMKNNKPSVYKVTFFGKTVSLNNTFGEDQLSNLNWLSNLSYDNTYANIKAGLNLGLDLTVSSTTYNDAIIYPLISQNQRYIYDSGGNYDNGGNLSIHSSNHGKRGVFPEDLKPAIKASLIIKAIEEQYGITFKSSEFFDSTEFSNVYLWMNREKGKISLSSNILIDSETFFCSSPSPASACTYFSSTAESQFVDGVFKIERTATIDEFHYTASVTPASGYLSVIYTIEIIDRLTNTVVSSTTGSGSKQTNIIYGGSLAGGSLAQEIALGEKKELVTRVSSESSLNFSINETLKTVDTGVSYQVVNLSTTSPLSLASPKILPNNQMPDIKIIDYLKGLFKMFNLTAFLDSNDEIVVKTLDDFYGDSTTTHDISQYVKTDENTVSEALPFSTIDLEYVEPQSKLAVTQTNLFNKKFGSAEFNANASRGKQYKVEAPFEHMLYERLINLGSGTYTEAQYGLMVNENDESFVNKPLLFYAIYQSSITDQINMVDNVRPEGGGLAQSTGPNDNLSAYWMPHNANELGTASTAPAFNLNFGSEINSYTLTDYGGNNNSLFQKFYENYIVRVFNTRTRIFKYKAILPLKFLLTYSLADKVFVNGRSFTINKITTKLQTGESSLELLNEPTS